MRQITEQEKRTLLSLKISDITARFIIDNFSDKVTKVNGKIEVIDAHYKPNDIMKLSREDYFNDRDIETTVGRFLFNKLLIEEKFKDIVGYINEPVNAKVQKKIDSKLAKALMEDIITVDDMVKYLDRTQWLSMQFNPILTSSFTMNTLKPIPQVMERKNKLIEENKFKLDKGDVITAVKIEKELQDLARKALADDPGMDLYDSGARGSFGNNYKNIALMKGPVLNPSTGQWEIAESSYMEGIKKKEIPIFGNNVITGAYPKAISTATSGYLGKQLTSAYQAIQLDKETSDCKTQMYITIKLTPNLYNDIIFRYIMEGTTPKPVLITEKNIDSYMGKEIRLRSPMFCIGEKLCNVCGGELFNLLNLKNVGLTTARVASTISNLNMKKFHDSSASIQRIDVNDLLI